jgi:hypothetical protein
MEEAASLQKSVVEGPGPSAEILCKAVPISGRGPADHIPRPRYEILYRRGAAASGIRVSQRQAFRIGAHPARAAGG